MAIESAVTDLIELVTHGFSAVQRKRYEGDIAVVVRYYFGQTFQTILLCIKQSLSILRDRVAHNLHGGILLRAIFNNPLFQVGMRLTIVMIIANKHMQMLCYRKMR